MFLSLKKVLIIDDEPDVLTVVKRRLESYQLQCFTALSAEEGLETAHAVQPDLILLDLMLPRMHGFNFLRKIKTDAQLARVPVIVLTALGDEDVATEAMELGAAGYLRKTCGVKDLISLIQSCSLQYGENSGARA